MKVTKAKPVKTSKIVAKEKPYFPVTAPRKPPKGKGRSLGHGTYQRPQDGPRVVAGRSEGSLTL